MEDVAKACEKIIHEIRVAYARKNNEKPKLSAWFGHEAWVELRRNVSLLALDMSASRDFNSLTYYGCDMKLDPDQPLHEVIFLSNGAPVRKYDTKAMTLDYNMSAPGVMAVQLQTMASVFKNGPMKVEAYPRIMSLRHLPEPLPQDPIETRDFSVNDWIDWGMVYMPEPRTYALTLAGKNAIEQFKSFA